MAGKDANKRQFRALDGLMWLRASEFQEMKVELQCMGDGSNSDDQRNS